MYQNTMVSQKTDNSIWLAIPTYMYVILDFEFFQFLKLNS